MMNLLEQMQEMTMELNAEELLAQVEETEIIEETDVDVIDYGKQLNSYTLNEFNTEKFSCITYHYTVFEKALVVEITRKSRWNSFYDENETIIDSTIDGYKVDKEFINSYNDFVKEISKKEDVAEGKTKECVDNCLKRKIKRLINRYGRYENNKDKFEDVVTRFDSEKDFLSIYEDIAYEETYTIKIRASIIEYEELYGDCYEDEEAYEDELEADFDLLETFKGHLEDFDFDELNEYRFNISCIGKKELDDFQEVLDTEPELELIEIDITYGLDGSYYTPHKNKNC